MAPPTGKSPLGLAPAVVGLFFPQSKSLGIDLTEHSPAVQKKIVYAGLVASSFENAADLLKVLSERPVPVKQVERLTRRIGLERVAERDREVTAFLESPLVEKYQAPAGVAPPDLAVVLCDGGRVQIFDRIPTQNEAAPAAASESAFWEEPTTTKGHWREDKIGTLLEMQSAIHETDPCPEVPAVFLDTASISKLAREIGKTAARGEGSPDEAFVPPGTGAVPRGKPAYEPPGVKHRLVVGSCRKWSSFAVIVAQAARAAGFQKARRRAFVADGSSNNWRLRERFFGSFTPVLDFIHGLTYVYGAATAGESPAAGWERYAEWIGWLWKGEVSKVIEELKERQREVGEPEKDESETSVRSVITRSLGYLKNHQDKMKYDEYRKQGLPVTSSLMESTVKQMNYRVKGSEKFWSKEGAEGIVQLRADHLSNDAPLDEFWERRQTNASGQRPYCRAA